ncbi:hypothetical protein TSUD_314910 [Trifolium subterraneum]|uniref:RNase H type-1 domain-containing protein n=1 Tax=Trifolium subterraneum TaxID=3900 RepID=A0A2Z6M2C0_TRISU|nr:hypothetical protein TSUD_314910 [Trifolium subterraneum]
MTGRQFGLPPATYFSSGETKAFMMMISFFQSNLGRHERVQQQVNINWLAPPSGWFALNTDGAAKISASRAGYGGVLRNETGIWIEGFTKALGDTTAYMAELWGIYEGLCLARRREVTRLEMHTDSQIIAQSLQDNKRGSNMGCTLMKKIRRLLEDS